MHVILSLYRSLCQNGDNLIPVGSVGSWAGVGVGRVVCRGVAVVVKRQGWGADGWEGVESW